MGEMGEADCADEAQLASEVGGQGAVVAAVAAALRQQSRQSVHPSDQMALWRAAVRIARALETEFRLTLRDRAPTAAQSEPRTIDRADHE